MKALDLTGERFGLLTVMEQIGHNRFGQRLWLCSCDCGGTTLIPAEAMKRGNTKSCGCIKSKQRGASRRAGSLYGIWRGMMRRCYEVGSQSYKGYGGRGIDVCERWHEYLNFEADMSPRPDGTSIDRIDNDGGYSPENCRWATPVQQSNNRRVARQRKDAKFIQFEGEVLSLREWANRLGMKKATLLVRLKNGWSVDRALTTPVGAV